jgi:hypothetical protein
MLFSLPTAAICFIVCHGGPADHFAIFAKELEKKGYEVQIFASGPALKKFQDHKINGVIPFDLSAPLAAIPAPSEAGQSKLLNKRKQLTAASLVQMAEESPPFRKEFFDLPSSEEETAVQIAKRCAEASVAITDVGHSFDVILQKALSQHAPRSLRLAYYDNPESFVPGGYSAVAAKVMRAAQGVLFANANLATEAIYEAPNQPIELDPNKRFGVGYYSQEQAQKIRDRRMKEHQLIRSQILAQCSLEDRGQKLLIYVGGNNEDYFSQAFPSFLRFLSAASQKSDFSNYVIVLQQHPGAKRDNFDGQFLRNWQEQNQQETSPWFMISQCSIDDVQIAADAMLYYQTSMGPQFVLAGIPAIQVGHNTYNDLLVKNQLCATATNENELLFALESLERDLNLESSRDASMQGLGVHSDWLERLQRFLEKTE